MIKKYFKKLREKRNVKQHLRGYGYACRCLINKLKTEEQLEAEAGLSKSQHSFAFMLGMIDAMEDLYFYYNSEILLK